MNWFVINENEHLGPFQEEVLKQLFKSGDLQRDTLVWKEGMDEPKSYADIFLSQTGPDLPLKNKGHEAPEEDEDEDELPPELPPEVLRQNRARAAAHPVAPPSAKTTEEVEAKKAEEDSEEEFEEDFEEEQGSDKKSGFWRAVKLLAAAFAIAGLAALSWMYYSTHFMNFSRPSKMGMDDFERLRKAASFKGEKDKWAFALAKDKSKIWMATNIPYTGEVTLKLSSVPGKILSNEPVAFTSKTRLKSRLAEFDTFEFEAGQRIIEGWYQVEAITPRELEVPLAAKFLSSRKRRFRYIDEILLTTMEEESFNRALRRMAQTQKRNDSAFWEELKQKYQTIKAIASKIHSSINLIFQSNGRDWDQRVSMFEQDYMENYGNFFTNFVIENERAYEQLKDKDFNDKTEVISNYTRLTRLAKKVGLETMNSLEDLQSLENPESEQNRGSLRQKIDARFESVYREADESLLLLENK